MSQGAKNVSASVRDRLLKLARERGEDFQLLLTRYANERLLYRLSISAHNAAFILKGAMLFYLWTDRIHRTTRDMDLLGFGEPSEERLRSIFLDVIACDVPNDGVRFDAATIEVGPIREAQVYAGIRVVVDAYIGAAKIRVQVDVGFGDAITPDARTVEFPVLLDLPAPQIRAYPRTTVVAEKLEAVVQLGMANSRMKDFYDLYVLPQLFSFDGELLVRAIRATFNRRGTRLSVDIPTAFTDQFSHDKTKNTQWTAFLRKSGITDVGKLPDAIETIASFAILPMEKAASGEPWLAKWRIGGPWRE